MLPSCVRLWHPGARRRAPQSCGCFKALCSFPSKVHNFSTTFSLQVRAELPASAPPAPCQPLLLLQRGPPRLPASIASPHAVEAHGTPSPATQPQPPHFTLQELGFISLLLLH